MKKEVGHRTLMVKWQWQWSLRPILRWLNTSDDPIAFFLLIIIDSISIAIAWGVSPTDLDAWTTGRWVACAFAMAIPVIVILMVLWLCLKRLWHHPPVKIKTRWP